MKTKKLLFASALFMSLFVSCTNEIENQTNDDYSEIPIDIEPYISSGMQELINKLDTAQTALNIEEIMPSLDKILKQDSLTGKVVSRDGSAEGSLIATGYSSTTNLFSGKSITITSDNSAFRESLDFISGNAESSRTYYLSCTAVCYYLYFTENTEFIVATKDGDFIGINPDKFDSNITNDSQFERGYHCEEKKANRLYYLTT